MKLNTKFKKNQWSLAEWQKNCPELTYKSISHSEIPDWLPSKLTDKFNSVIIASSGNTNTFVGIIMGYRIDKNEIDEHPYVVAFNKHNGNAYSSIIEHGKWEGRTTDIPIEMQKLLKINLKEPYPFQQKPQKVEGTLNDLKNQGIFDGYEKSVSYIEKKRNNK
jgi:hypothetical protein